MNKRAFQIYENVINALQDADEIEGLEGKDYLNLMEAIRFAVVKRYNNCADNMEVEEEEDPDAEVCVYCGDERNNRFQCCSENHWVKRSEF
jgi:hypothetical protein